MRHLLFTGLFICLGFSLSMNPSLHAGERSLASEGTDGKLTTFDMEKYDASHKGLKVSYELDTTGTEKRVRYFVEGSTPDVCGDCSDLGKAFSEPLSDQNVQNVEILNRMISEMAMKKIIRKKPEVVAKTEVVKEKKKKLSVETACDGNSDSTDLELSAEDQALLNITLKEDTSALSERLECKAKEIQEINDECKATFETAVSGMSAADKKSAAAERRACLTKVDLYYTKFLKKDLAAGLASKSDEQFAASATYRDAILQNLPGKSAGVKADIMRITKAGMLDRAKNNFLVGMANKAPGQTAAQIATAAKLKMIGDLQGMQTANFCSAYTGLDSLDCMSAATNPQARGQHMVTSEAFKSYANEFLNPLEQFASSQRSSETDFDRMIGNSTGLDPNLLGASPAPPAGFYDARKGMQNRGGGSGMLLPTPGLQGATQGQLIVPTASVQNQVQYQAPAQVLPAQAVQAPTQFTAPAIQSTAVSYPTTPGMAAPRTAPVPVAPPVAPTTMFQQPPTQFQGLTGAAPAIRR